MKEKKSQKRKVIEHSLERSDEWLQWSDQSPVMKLNEQLLKFIIYWSDKWEGLV